MTRFEFNGSYLSYYKAAGKKPLGWILLDPETRVLKADKKPYCFVVKTLKRRLFLSCDNEDELRLWMKVLRLSVARFHAPRRNGGSVVTNNVLVEATAAATKLQDTDPKLPSSVHEDMKVSPEESPFGSQPSLEQKLSEATEPEPKPKPKTRPRLLQPEDRAIFRRSIVNAQVHFPLPPLSPIDEQQSDDDEEEEEDM